MSNMNSPVPLATIQFRASIKHTKEDPPSAGFLTPNDDAPETSYDCIGASRQGFEQERVLYPGEVVLVGRDDEENTVSIDHEYVSKTHFIIYSITDDHYGPDSLQPLVYVRDWQSARGTLVNDTLIGSRAQGNSSGFLLSHGDTIKIHPYWSFDVKLEYTTKPNSVLTTTQRKEAELFSDRYHITDRTLGVGNFGSIYLAVEKKTGKQLVCKVCNLDKPPRNSPDYARRILYETDILGKLRHRHLLDFVYAFRSRHTQFLFTELATGGDLYAMACFYNRQIPFNEVKFVVRQLVSAVRYLHKLGVVHRDLKPENIFFATGPYISNRVILGDFGFAKGSTWSRMASTVGTQGYMAPEIRTGAPYSTSVDMWSIGMVTLFLLRSECPSSLIDVTDQRSVDQAVDKIFLDIASSSGHIDNMLKHFVKATLTLDPVARLTSRQAKAHPWFQQQPAKDEYNKLTEKYLKEWKPRYLITPPVEELPEVELRGAADHSTSLIQSQNTKAATSDGSLEGVPITKPRSRKSPYFLAMMAHAPKRPKTSLA